jgi:hypothetical protein
MRVLEKKELGNKENGDSNEGRRWGRGGGGGRTWRKNKTHIKTHLQT